MKLTSRLYIAYTEVLTEILSNLAANTLGHAELHSLIQNTVEKLIPLSIPALLANSPFSPSEENKSPHLEHLKEAWIITLLSDIRLSLLISHHVLTQIQRSLAGVTPLFDPCDLDTFRPPHGDPFTGKPYRQIMQTLLDARQNRQIVRLLYIQDTASTPSTPSTPSAPSAPSAPSTLSAPSAPSGTASSDSKTRRVTGSFLPLRIDYNPSTDRFRGLVQKIESGAPISTLFLGIAHIIDARSTATTTPASPPSTPIPSLFEDYLLVPPQDPLLLEIPDSRMLFEHCRHAFAAFDQRVQYDGSSHVYTCMFSCKPQEEDSLTALLTDLDPSIRILSPLRIARQVRTNRLRRQQLAGRAMDGY